MTADDPDLKAMLKMRCIVWDGDELTIGTIIDADGVSFRLVRELSHQEYLGRVRASGLDRNTEYYDWETWADAPAEFKKYEIEVVQQ